MVKIFRALSDKTRIRILNLLSIRELCVCEIETILDLTQSNASRHLNRLKDAKIITDNKKSQWVFYKINSSFIKEHKLLYEYLNQKFKDIVECRQDLEKLKVYTNNRFTCKDIGEDKEKVLCCLNNKCGSDDLH
ncbi:MAG TPA: winged helix-turn-helix transcriptional regulator [Thermoanaerobacterales bacterium]|nr:winged helix-turn-helix transcriptional regulator [Thermoanaerobacterales bacterium]